MNFQNLIKNKNVSIIAPANFMRHERFSKEIEKVDVIGTPG